MSLALVENAVLEYVGDVIVNECGRPVPSVVRYHTTLPDDCCTDDGVLSISWDRFNFSDRIPGTSAASNAPCPGVPYAQLTLRYVVCWPVPTAPAGGGVVLPYAKADATAAMLADVSECVAIALARVACDPSNWDELSAEVHARVMQDTIRFVESVPVSPSGGCAGVLWKLTLSPREAVTGS